MKLRFLSTVIFIVFFLTGCASEIYLRTETAGPSDVAVTFNVILYGNRYADDIENVAILDVSGDRYTFEPFAPSFDFSIVEDVPAKEAFEIAERFVSSHPDVWQTQVGQILDLENRIIGYEVRPLYSPVVHGIADVMDVDYWLRPEGTVRITIRLKPQIERMLHGGNGHGMGQGK
jgi:hypothetical protein